MQTGDFILDHQQQFNKQLELEERLNNLQDFNDKQSAIFGYLESVLLDKLVVPDFGKGKLNFCIL